MSNSITLKQAAKAYLEFLKTQGKSSRTVSTYSRDLAQVQHFFGSERLLCSILKVHVGKFYKSPILLNKPDGTPRAKASLTKTIRVFRMFMLWAQAQGYIQELPLTKDTPMGRSHRQSREGTSASTLLCSNDLEMTGN
jgi:site-specific recombinase XerD